MESKGHQKPSRARAPETRERAQKHLESIGYFGRPLTDAERQSLQPFLGWVELENPNRGDLGRVFGAAETYAFFRALQSEHPKRRPGRGTMGELEKARREHLKQIQDCAEKLADLIDRARGDLGVWMVVARAFEGERYLVPAPVAEALTAQLRTLVKDAKRVLREQATQRDVVRKCRADKLKELAGASQCAGRTVPWAALASLLEVFGVNVTGSELQTEAGRHSHRWKKKSSGAIGR